MRGQRGGEGDEDLRVAATRLNSTGLAFMLAMVAGLGLFLATNWLVLKGGPIGSDGAPVVGPTLGLLGQFFIGYRVSFIGSLIGFAWGFVTGGILGWLIGRAYNWIVATGDVS